MRNTYTILVVKPEGKIPLGIPKCRWEDNIRMELIVEWRALVNMVMKLWLQKKKGREFLD
jgi:hypothetical protein